MSTAPSIGQHVRVGTRIGTVIEIDAGEDAHGAGAYDIARYIIASADEIWDAYLDELIPVNAPGPTRCKLQRLRAATTHVDAQLTLF